MDNGLNCTHNALNTKPRIAVIDSLRGMAIAAIFLIHTSNHFLYNSFPADTSLLDEWVRSMLYFLFENKAYAIFAALFGFTFALQMDSYRRHSGGDFGRIMLWRMVLLVLIGVVNAALFVGGDPLVFYALTMMLVIPLRNLSTRVLSVLCLVFLLQPVELLNTVYEWYSGVGYYEEYGFLNEVMVEGDALSTFWAGATVGLKGCLKWAVETGRFTQTLGLFLLGIIGYRSQIFGDMERWSRHYIIYIVATLVTYFGAEYLFEFLRVYYNLFFLLSGAAIFVTLFRKFRGRGVFNWLAYYGRMSLTNFVMQSLFGAVLYYPWGLDLGSKLGVFSSCIITLGLIVLQIIFSRFWLKRFKRGALEELWHRATHFNCEL